jgi:tetratricopeptide (TPR) repeat protein
MTAPVRCAALFAIVALMLVAPVARAEDVAAAREHYKKGTTYYDLGKYADAAREFEAAYEAKNDPAILFNLAQAYRLSGDTDQALHFYRTYLRYVPKAANRSEIEEQIKALEQKQAQKPATTPPAATAPLPPPPTATPTAPPPVPVPAPGGPAVVTTSPLAPPPLASDSGPLPPPTRSDPGRTFRIAGIAAGGVGAVMILVGLAEGGRAHAAANDLEQAAANGEPFDPDIQSRGKTAEKAQWWLLGLGVVAGAAGGGLWYYGHHTTEKARAAGTVSFAPILGPGRSGAFMQVRF